MPFHLCSTHVHIESKHGLGSVCHSEIRPGGFSEISGRIVLSRLVDRRVAISSCDFSLCLNDDPSLMLALEKLLGLVLTLIDGNIVKHLLGGLVDMFIGAVSFLDELD